MKEICDMNKCTACQACLQVCPKKAITMEANELGILLPVIDEEKCVDCGVCKKACQANEMLQLNKPQYCYAVWTKDEKDRQLCSSGGLATGFAKKIIRENGVVFGAVFNEQLQLEISGAENEEKAEKFRGSKYVQCSTGASYPDVKRYLIEGRKVLYVGTPCQIMGLRKYLGKDYENLLLVDIICHGVPPYSHLEQHIKHVCPDEKITNITFRGKHDFKLTLYQDEQIVYCRDRYEDAYFTAFLEGLNYRESCYSCSFAVEERTSDITIGDFWGLKRETMQQKYSGRISTALLNTQKGIEFFESIKDMFYFEERTVSESVKGNAQLNHATRRPAHRTVFCETYVKEGFEGAYEKARRQEDARQNALWRKGLRKIKRTIRKIIPR